MQVVCERCQARYEFDRSAIPAAGYTAQCSHCSATFFVTAQPALHLGPPAPADAAAAQPKARPASPSAMAEALAEKSERHRPGSSVGRRPSLASLFSDDLHHADTPEAAAEPSPVKAASATPTKRHRRRGWSHVTGQVEDEAALAPRSRARLGLVVGMMCTALVALGVVVGVMRSKQLHLPTQVPPPLKIVHDPPQAAVDAFTRGMQALWRDNDQDFGQAAEAFVDARSLDIDYTDAWAGEALACLLRAQNARARLREAAHTLATSGQQLNALAEAQGARARVLVAETGDAAHEDNASADMDADAEGSPQALRALEIASASIKLRAALASKQEGEDKLLADLQRVQQNLAHAASLLLHATELPAQTPMLATVMALWFADDESAHALVLPQLKTAEQLGARLVEQPRRTWSGEQTHVAPPVAPFASWRMLVRAQLAMAQQQGAASADADDPVVEALMAALRLEPGMRRAKWQLATYLLQHHRTQQAQVYVRELAEAQPRHEQAYALWQRVYAGEPAPPPP